MIIKNDALIASFRGAASCEYCRKPCRETCAHHCFTVRSGRLDIPHNLIRLGMPFQCPCHDAFHKAAKIKRDDFLAVVAKRERVTVEVIERVVYALRFLPRSPAGWQIREAVGPLCEASRRVVEGILKGEGLTWET